MAVALIVAYIISRIFGYSDSDLLAAVRGNDLDRVKKLIQSGVNPNINCGQGGLRELRRVIPLHVAASNGQKDMIKCLLEFKADIEIIDGCGRTALHWAAGYRCHNIVKLLISHGADVNKQDTFGLTALHLACHFSRVIGVLRLFEHVDLRKRVTCVRILLEHGADVGLRNRDGKTARDLALEMNESAAVKQLDDFSATRKEANSVIRRKNQRELNSVKAELAELKNEMEQLASLKAEMASLKGRLSDFRWCWLNARTSGTAGGRSVDTWDLRDEN